MSALPGAGRRAPRPHVVVVGNGMAGARVAERVRTHDPQRLLDLTVFGEEPHGAYNRVLLSEVLAGRHRGEDIRLGASGWPFEQGVQLHLGVPVTAVDRTRREVHAADGSVTPYDVLVLATGSQPFVPSVPGLRGDDGGLVEGAHAFRTLDDCGRIEEAAQRSRRAVVLGGGLLGLEAARGLAGRGLDVVVVHNTAHLMDRQLDPGAGRVLARALADHGVRVRVDARTTGVVLDEHGRVGGVRLDDGSCVLADLLVVACGVRPETGLARAAGLDVDRGVVVDDTLRSVTDRRVFAVGECAQHAGHVYGLVAPAWEQAEVVALNVTGADPSARYAGSRTVTRLKAAGVELAAMGETLLDDDDPAEVVQFADPARRAYKKLVIRDGRLVGAILLGELGTVGTVTQLYDRGSAVPPDRLSLLFGARRGTGTTSLTDSPATIPAAATICRCNGVTKGRIQEAVLSGARTVGAVAAATRATTGCGGCTDAVCGIVDWLSSAEPAAGPVLAPAPGPTTVTAAPPSLPEREIA